MQEYKSAGTLQTLGPPLVQKPKAYPWYKDPRSILGTHSYKTQGTPLVCSLAATTTTTIKGPGPTGQTTTRLVDKTFN